MKDIIVIYHGGDCLDGLAAAANMFTFFGDKAEYVAAKYGEPVPDILDKAVYLVDFSYPRAVLLEQILPYAKHVTLIDHHITALEDLWDLPNLASNFNMDFSSTKMSGAMLTWRWKLGMLPSDATIAGPRMIKIIQDRDMWEFKYDETEAVTAALFSYNLDVAGMLKMIQSTDRQIDRLAAEGNTLMRSHNLMCKKLIETGLRWIEFNLDDDLGSYRFSLPVVNAPYMFASSVGNLLSKEYNIAMTYYDDAVNRNFSIRANKEVDIGDSLMNIAKAFGGGGHKNAAGFKVPRTHYLAMR